MLVLSRKKGESVVVDGPCEVTVLSFDGAKVRLGFTADREVPISRSELLEERKPIPDVADLGDSG